jgi:hypothetical protein
MTIRRYFKACAIAWMGGCVFLYFLVTVPADSFIATMLPDLVWRLRAAVLPWFYSEAIVH